MLSTRDPPQNKNSTQTESEGMEKYAKQKDRRKKTEVAILISEKVDFKAKAITRDKEGHYIIVKEVVQ